MAQPAGPTPTTFYDQGLQRMQQGDFRGALADFDAAVRADPGWADAYVQRAAARLNSGDAPGAIADYTEALQRGLLDRAKIALVYHNRGYVRAQQGDVAGAIADYSEAMRFLPHWADVYFHRGTARAQAGDTAGAAADLQAAIAEYDAAGNRAGAEQARAQLAALPGPGDDAP
ncbi:MAG TPA: tetratricopeptide repeat protein [Chloroflexota bacterium]